MMESPQAMIVTLIALALSISPSYAADDADAWWKKSSLFGESIGLANLLDVAGLRYELVYTGEFFTNLRGGISSTDARAQRGDLSLTVELDTEKAGLWRGGTFSVMAQIERGSGISADFTGAYQEASNIVAEDFQQVSECWYEHRFLDNELWIRLGIQDFAHHFSSADHGAEFLNASAGLSPSVPIVSYPYTDIGFAAGLQPVEWYLLEVSVSRGRGTVDDDTRGAMHIIEQTIMGRPFDLDGSISIAFYATTAEYLDLQRHRVADGVRGWFLTFDQFLWRDTEAGGQEGRHLGLFVQFGSSPPDRVETQRFLSIGLEARGPFAGRPDDIAGIGAFTVHFSPWFGRATEGEQVIEAYYRLQLLPWLSLKPDIQFIRNPGGEALPQAVACGVRMEMSF